ncbi:hypothetical protein BC828DRAFT_418515 [Blastocladiella britannica]|nr:hypothetical protein BC828DRAFT_418515 [Blastocladiella britannica]
MNALLASLPTELLAKILVLTDDPLTVLRLTAASLAWSTGLLSPADHPDLWAALIDAHVPYASSCNVNMTSPRDWYFSAALNAQVLVALSPGAATAASADGGTGPVPPVDLVTPGVARIVVHDTSSEPVVDMAHTRTAIHLRHHGRSNHVTSVVRTLPQTLHRSPRACACCQHSALNTVDEGGGASLFMDRPNTTTWAAATTGRDPSVYVHERTARSASAWESLQGRGARASATSFTAMINAPNQTATFKQPRDGAVRVTHMSSAGLASWSATIDGGVYWTCVQQRHFDVRVPPIVGHKGGDIAWEEGDITELAAISTSMALVRSRSRGWAVVSSHPPGPNGDVVHWRPEFHDMAAPVLPPGCTSATDSAVVLGITHEGRLLEFSVTDPTATAVPCAWWTPELASRWIPLRVTAGGGWGAAILAAPVSSRDGVWAESALAVRKAMVPCTLSSAPALYQGHHPFGSGSSSDYDD